MHSFQCVLQQHPAAGLQPAEHTARLPSLGGIAAEAEGLQVADVVRTAPVPGHDGVHLQGPLLRGLPSNSLRRSIRSGPWPG
jgi:hypothetical protein